MRCVHRRRQWNHAVRWCQTNRLPDSPAPIQHHGRVNHSGARCTRASSRTEVSETERRREPERWGVATAGGGALHPLDAVGSPRGARPDKRRSVFHGEADSERHLGADRAATDPRALNPAPAPEDDVCVTATGTTPSSPLSMPVVERPCRSAYNPGVARRSRVPRSGRGLSRWLQACTLRAIRSWVGHLRPIRATVPPDCVVSTVLVPERRRPSASAARVSSQRSKGAPARRYQASGDCLRTPPAGRRRRARHDTLRVAAPTHRPAIRDGRVSHRAR